MTSEADRVRMVNLLRSSDWLAEPELGLDLRAVKTAAACRPAPERCSRRTSRASSHRATGPFLVLAVRGRCAPERGRKLGRSGEGRIVRVDASGQSRGDLLEQPAIAVRIFERGERAVAAVLGIRAADAAPPKQIGLIRAGVHVAAAMENLADLDAASKQLVAGGLDVGNDQVQSLGGAGCRGGDVLAKNDRGRRAGRCELNDPPVVTGSEVGIQPPTQAAVKTLGAIDVRNGDDDDFELHGDTSLACGCHGSLLDVCERAAWAAVDQLSATSTTAWAKASGASWGRLCPMPPSMVRCVYLPENFLAYEPGSECGAPLASPSSVMVGTVMTGLSASRLSRSPYFGSPSARPSRQR